MKQSYDDFCSLWQRERCDISAYETVLAWHESFLRLFDTPATSGMRCKALALVPSWVRDVRRSVTFGGRATLQDIADFVPYFGVFFCVLSLFAGDRRENDVRHWTEGFCESRPFHIIVVNADILATQVDMLNPAVVDTWVGHIRSGRVLAALIFPPSQSWAPALADARTKAEHDPPSQRLYNMPRSLSGLSARQLRRVNVASCVLQVCLLVACECVRVGASCVVEHLMKHLHVAHPRFGGFRRCVGLYRPLFRGVTASLRGLFVPPLPRQYASFRTVFRHWLQGSPKDSCQPVPVCKRKR